MKKSIVKFSIIVSSLSIIGSAWAAPTDAQLEAAKNNAAAYGQIGNSMSPTLNSNGTIATDASGKPITQSTGSDGLRTNLKYFQNLTGLSGISPESSPSSGPQAAGVAGVSMNNYVDFTCPSSNKSVNAGALAFKVVSCQMTGATVNSVSFKQCDDKLAGGFCSKDEEYDVAFTMTAGVYSKLDNVEYGLACNAASACRLTVKGSFRYGGGGSNLTAGNGITNATTHDSVNNTLLSTASSAKTATGQTTGEFMNSMSTTIQACNAEQEKARAEGKIVTCVSGDPAIDKYASKNKAMSLSDFTEGDTCGSGATTTTTTTTNYVKTCEQSTPITERTTTYQVQNRTLTCKAMADANGNLYPLTKRVWVADPDKGKETGDTGSVGAAFKWIQSSLFALSEEGDGCGGGDCSVGTGAGHYETVVNLQAYANGNTMNTDEYCRYYTGTTTNPTLVDKVAAQQPLTLIGSQPTGCVDSSCYQHGVRQYWVNMTGQNAINVTESPTPVGGQCDTSSDTMNQTCEEGGWYGRYLSDEQCTILGTDSYGQVRKIGENVTYQTKAGCGVCLKPIVSQVCIGTSTESNGCSDVDPTECTFVDSKIVSLSSIAGIPLTVEKTFKCTATSEITAANSTGACTSAKMTRGLSAYSAPVSGAGFNEAMVNASIADQSVRGMSDQTVGPTVVPRIFSGAYGRCYRPEGFLGGLTQKNCCDTGLERPKTGTIIANGCDLDAVKLAANRRQGFSVYIGSWCSQEIDLLFTKKCIERAEGYCMFPGTLPKLVQQQGRQQLASFAYNSTTNASKGSIAYTYTNTQDAGQWTSPVKIGNTAIAAWKWSKQCSDPAKAAEAVLNGDNTKCPAFVETYIAACENGACGDLPSDPIDNNSGWTVKPLDPLKNEISDVTRYTTVKGGCDTANGNCNYDVSVWPTGVGGKAYTSRELIWQLYSLDTTQTVSPGDTPAEANQVYNLTGVGNMEFKGHGYAGGYAFGSAMPTTIPFEYSTDAGSHWRTFDLPTSAPNPITLPGTDITISGSCDQSINLCSYRMRGTVSVSAKPWGSPQAPDCSGFTAGQLAVLDFSKMDLSEFTAQVMKNIKGKTVGIQDAAAEAAKQTAEFNALMSNGKVAVDSPTSSNFVKVTPSEGIGPFNVRLMVASYYSATAEDNNRVIGLTVDWDDCNGPQTMAVKDNGMFFDKTYNAADTYACKGGKQQAIDHTITLKAQTLKTGVVTTTVVVRNGWSNMTGFGGSGVGTGSSSTIVNSPTAPSPYK